MSEHPNSKLNIDLGYPGFGMGYDFMGVEGAINTILTHSFETIKNYQNQWLQEIENELKNDPDTLSLTCNGIQSICQDDIPVYITNSCCLILWSFFEDRIKALFKWMAQKKPTCYSIYVKKDKIKDTIALLTESKTLEPEELEKIKEIKKLRNFIAHDNSSTEFSKNDSIKSLFNNKPTTQARHKLALDEKQLRSYIETIKSCLKKLDMKFKSQLEYAY